MSLIRDLYSRFAHIGAEGLKFCVVGGVGAIFQLVIQDGLHLEIGIGPLTAETAGIVAGIIVTFLGNRYWTYAHKRSHGKAFIRETWQFMMWAAIGWFIQEGLQAIGYYGLNWRSGLAYTVVTCFGIGVATVFRFWAYRTFVFTGSASAPPPAPAAAPVEAESLEAEPTA